MAIDPDYQGKGLGKKLVSSIVEKADQLGLPSYLGTQNPTNLVFYGKMGFKVIKEARVEHDGPMIWLLKREYTGRNRYQQAKSTNRKHTSYLNYVVAIFVLVLAVLLIYLIL